MTLNITEGCYVKLRNGAIMGPVKRGTWPDRPWCILYAISWKPDGVYGLGPNNLDIIEVLPGKPVFIDTPFEVGKTYRMRGGGNRTVEGFALRLCNGTTRYLNGAAGSRSELTSDLLPGDIEDEEEVTVTMSKADYERAMELLKGAK